MECTSQVTCRTTVNAAVADVELSEIASSNNLGCGRHTQQWFSLVHRPPSAVFFRREPGNNASNGYKLGHSTIIRSVRYIILLLVEQCYTSTIPSSFILIILHNTDMVLIGKIFKSAHIFILQGNKKKEN